MAFLVILLSPRGPHHPRIVPIIPMSSPHHPCQPRHPHVVPIAPRRSPCGLHMLSLSSPSSPHHPRHPHVVPIAPRRSPCGLHGLWSPHVVPVIPIIPTSSRRSPHHLNPPDTHSTHPPPPWGWGPRISKNAIRFELIKIF